MGWISELFEPDPMIELRRQASQVFLSEFQRRIKKWSKSMNQIVSMGRIVIYKHPGSADGKFPSRESPAIVQEVMDAETGKCRLFVFGPLGQHMDVVEQGNGPSQWHWPVKVEQPDQFDSK